MIAAERWRQTLEAARWGEAEAADQIAQHLLQWACRQIPRPPGPSEDDLSVSFAEHLIRDQFSHLPLNHCPLKKFLDTSWRHFLINWLARDERRRARELPWAEWARMERDDDDEAAIDSLPSADPGPEAIIIQRAELKALRAEVSRLSPVKQQIFALFFEEGLSEGEIGRDLGMNPQTVTWHVYTIRRHLRARREAS